MSSSEELAAELQAMQDKLQEIKEFMAPIQAENASILAEKRALQETFEKAMADIKEREAKAKQAANNYVNEEWLLKQKALQIQQKLDAMEAAKKAEEEAAKAAAEEKAKHAALTERWDRLTAAAPWREWAKDHQIEGAHKIVEDRYVILADPMGLGKTLTSIITTDMAFHATKLASEKFPFLGIEKEVHVPGYWKAEDGENLGSFVSTTVKQERNATWVPSGYETKIVDGITRPVGKRILYICPNTLLRNVMSEFRMWAPHRSVTSVGGMTRAERGFIFDFVLPNQTDYVIVCNYEAWRKDMSLIDKFCELKFDTVIIDEAHNAKDMQSIVFRGIDRILKTNRPEFIIPMTGTPILNRPQELFTLLNMVNHEQFYRLNDFLYQYCYQNDDGFWVFQEGGLERIAKRIRKNFLRRTKDEVGIDLPEKTIIYHDIEVDEEAYPEQARVRKQMRDYATIMIDEAKGKALSAAAMIAVFTRLRQVETWPAGIRQEITELQGGKKVVVDTIEVDVRESQKIDYIIRRSETGEWDGLIPEAIDDERMVLFSQFKAPLYEIAERVRLAGYRPIVLDGSTPADVKEQIRTDFDARYTADRSKSKWDIVLCNYRVGGVGLNLTAASQLIALDEEWNPGKRDQAFDRIHRMGQEKPVTIHVIRNQKTIDDWLANIMENKEKMVDGFNTAMVTTQDFKDALDSGLI